MSSTKLTSKFQATIPKDIRKKLKLKAGDSITFGVIDNNTVVIKKSSPLDKEYLRAVQNTLSEWDSPEDEEAYADLQDL